MNADDINRLNAKDKAELLQFVNTEQQRSKVQENVHGLTEMCWKKCVTSVKGNTLDKGEETCLASCVDRFLDVSIKTANHLSNRR